MCRTELSPGALVLVLEGLFEKRCRLFFPILIAERNSGTWGRLTATQRRTMDKVVNA